MSTDNGSRYGDSFWTVKLRNGEMVVFWADSIRVTDDGALLAVRTTTKVVATSESLLGFAAGTWDYYCATDILNGAPVAVEQWDPPKRAKR